MDGSLHHPHLTRLLFLNTEAHQLRTELMRQPLGPLSCKPGRIAELQESIDLCRRASLATCWMSEGYELDDEGSGDDEDYLISE